MGTTPSSGIDFELRAATAGDIFRGWRWATARPKFHPYSGGRLGWHQYLAWAQAPHRKQIAARRQGETLCLVTVELTAPDEYLLHVTSPRRANLPMIINATYQCGWQLFHKLGAELVYTQSPSINGHAHRGSRALCEGCHLRPYGMPEPETIEGIHYQWQLFQMTRADWLRNEQTEVRHRQAKDSTDHAKYQHPAATAAIPGSVWGL